MPLDVATGPAPSLTLEGPGGRPIELADYWAQRPTVFFFLRHFG